MKYKDAMVSQAKLFDEKTSLVYQVESLKDELEDTQQETEFVRGELQHHQSVGLPPARSPYPLPLVCYYRKCCMQNILKKCFTVT